MFWVTKSQNLGPSLFWRALRSRVMDVVHLHQMSRISPLSFHTPHPTHTPTGLTWKIRVQIYHYRNFVHKYENKKKQTAPCTTAATPSAEVHPIGGSVSGVLLDALEQARQVGGALDLNTSYVAVNAFMGKAKVDWSTWVTNSFSCGCLSAPGMVSSAATALIADLFKACCYFFLILFKEMHFCKIKIRQDTNTPFQLVLLLVFLLHAIRLHLCRACQLQRLHQPIKSGFMITSVYKKDKTCPISGEQHQDKAGTPCNDKIVLQCFNLSISLKICNNK